jgi:hypothetical protein
MRWTETLPPLLIVTHSTPIRFCRACRLCVFAALALAWCDRGHAQMTSVIDARAQAPGSVRGRVVNAVTGKPMPNVTVQVAGANSTVLTEPDGRFHLLTVAPGTRALLVSADGMQRLRVVNVPVQPGKMVELIPLELQPALGEGVQMLEEIEVIGHELMGAGAPPVSLTKIVVTPSRYGVAEDALAATTTLTRADIEILPQWSEDLYRALSRLPGLSTSDSSARFWVRGAPNDQVLSRYDGVDLLEPFHVKDFDGALSIVDLATIGRIDLMTGGFTGEYGDRLAGVLVMESELFDPKRAATSVGLSVDGLRYAHRGTLAGGRGNWLIAARAGYPDLELADRNRPGSKIEPRYRDVSAKAEYRITPSHSISVHVLHARDDLAFSDPGMPYSGSNYQSDYGWVRWQGALGDGVVTDTVISLARHHWDHQGNGDLPERFAIDLRDSRDLLTAAARQDWSVIFSERGLVRGGFNASSSWADYRYHLTRTAPHDPAPPAIEISDVPLDPIRRDVTLSPAGDAFGGYVAPRLRLNSKLTLEPSLRLDRTTYEGSTTLSPRFNLSYAVGRVTVRGARGIYYQSQGLQQLAVADGDTAFHRPERAEHRVISIEYGLPRRINWRVEVYERIATRLRPHWENLINVDEVFPELRGDRRRIDPVHGITRGAELTVESRSRGPLNWRASYALASAEERVTETDVIAGVVQVNESTLPRSRDQRHTVVLDASYAPSQHWQFSAAWQYHSGWPATEVMFTTEVRPEGRVYIAHIGRPYGLRLPAYHRLDARITRRFETRHGQVRLYADVFNVYDRENIQGYAFSPRLAGSGVVTDRQPLKQFSLLPTVGAAWDF